MSYSFPTATALGVLANGADQTSALNAALSNGNYKGICFDYTPGAKITINGAVDASNKILQFLNGSILTGTGSIIGGYIDADYNSQIWDTPNPTAPTPYIGLLIKPQGTVGKYYSLKWSGAANGSGLDDWLGLQNDINICTYNGIAELYLPAGNYRISKGLLFRKDAGGQYQGLTPPSISNSVFLLGFNLTGDGISYDGSTGQTAINLTNANSFAIGLQRVKGFKCRGLYITGVNTGLASYTPYQVMQDPSSTFLTNSSRDNPFSPHAGINVDPFSSSSTSSSDMYPDFTGYYAETSTGGSTDVSAEDCVFRYFAVGRAISINGFSHNGEIITFKNTWGDFNKVSLATGQSQARSVICFSDHVWGGTMTIYDSVSYGDSGDAANGEPVTSIGLNVAGGNRYLCKFGDWISNGLFIKNAHIELLWSLGGNFLGPSNQLTIEDSWINLTGSNSMLGVNPPFTIFNGAGLKLTNCILFQYGADIVDGEAIRLPLSIHASVAIFETCSFDVVPINNSSNNTSFKDCTAGASFGDSQFIVWNQVASISGSTPLFTTGMKAIFSCLVPGGGEVIMKERRKATSNYVALIALYYSKMYRDIVVVRFSETITLLTLSYSSNTATFSLSVSTVDYNNLMIGDKLLFYTTDEFGNTNILTAFGQVTTLSSGTVSIGGIAQNLTTSTNYTLYIYRNEFLIPGLILGDVTSGSNKVLNVVAEGNITIPVNVPVYIPHFPLGTYIVSYDSGTMQLLLSNEATITENNVAILSSDWHGQEIGGFPILDNPYYLGYKKGDIVYNIGTAYWPNITYWECSKSGITGTSRIPEFISYGAKESNSKSAASVTGSTADSNKVVFLDASSNSIAYGVDPVAFKNLNQSLFGIIAGANTITITPSSGTINGAASYSLANNQCINIYSDGTNFYIIT